MFILSNLDKSIFGICEKLKLYWWCIEPLSGLIILRQYAYVSKIGTVAILSTFIKSEKIILLSWVIEIKMFSSLLV